LKLPAIGYKAVGFNNTNLEVNYGYGTADSIIGFGFYRADYLCRFYYPYLQIQQVFLRI
jgi:hypothetical protein